MLKQVILISAFFFIINATYNGIDISSWQGKINEFYKVRRAGYSFVILRAGYGHGTGDKNFETNWKYAKDARLNIGAYWTCKATSIEQSKYEALMFIIAMRYKQFEYPVYYDMEYKETFKLGKELTSKIADNFCKILEEHKYYCGIYASKDDLENYFTSDVLKKYPIWVAQYKPNCTYSGEYQMWQNSTEGKILGLKGKFNTDISYVDYPTIIKRKKMNGF